LKPAPPHPPRRLPPRVDNRSQSYGF
jgi:hypothetical protein